MQGQEQIYIQTGHLNGLCPKGRETERSLVRQKQGARMRLKAHDDQWNACRSGELPGLTDDSSVPTVDAVEVPDRNNASLKIFGNVLVMSKYPHHLFSKNL